MTLHTKVGIVMTTVAVFVLPIIIVQAQAEGEGEQPANEVVVEQSEVVTVAEEGADIGGQAVAEEEVAVEQAEDTTATAGEEEGSVLGADAVAGEEDETAAESERALVEVAATEVAATTTSASEAPAVVESAAASTTPAGDPPAAPVEEPFVLQPAVKLHVNGSSVAADISLDNLTCKSCGKALPAMAVKVYYAAWYPNDGPEYKETGARIGEQEVNVSDVALWNSRAMSWSANNIAPGPYYFVIVVDPEDAHGAYYLYRTEFAI